MRSLLIAQASAAKRYAAIQSYAVASTKGVDSLMNTGYVNVVQSSTSGSGRWCYWQDIVRKNEDLDAVAERMERVESSEGIDSRRKETHEKPTARRKRMKGELEYRIKKEKVMDVVRYVKWKKNAEK